MKKYILLIALVVLVILILSTKYYFMDTQEKNKQQGTSMTIKEKKEALLGSLDTQRKYYLVNKKEEKYAVLYLEITKKGKYKLEKVTNLSFLTTPLEYVSKQRFYKYTDKIELYNSISTILEKLFKVGYDEIYFEKNSYLEGVDKYISDITAGVPDLEYSADEAKLFVHVETKENTFLRYDMYETAIKVNLDVIKNNKLVSKELYTLWYPNYEAVKKAMKETLKDVKHTNYSFKEFVNYVESMKNSKRIEKVPEEIIFEHLIKTKSYSSTDTSDLAAILPRSKFQKFDPYDIEQGRIYFWIKKDKTDILKSKIEYFVLENRKKDAHYISSATLASFNNDYIREESLMSHSLSDEIKYLLERVEKSYVEISQEEVIEILTNKKADDVMSQKIEKTLYLEDNVYDIYENMIQHWAIGEESDEFMYHTTFYKSKEQRDKWLQKELAAKKSDGIETSTKKADKKLLHYYKELHDENEKYLEQKTIKDKIVRENPSLKENLKAYEFRRFMQYSPLKVIEGNYEVNASWLLNASESSWIIKGDLIVNGTLLYKKDNDTFNNNFMVVLGDVKVKNYLHKPEFSLMVYAKNLVVENITYLPAASRSWYIHIIGELKTDVVIHTKSKKVNDEKILLNNEYSTTNKNIFVNSFFNGKYANEMFMYKQLEAGKELLIHSKINKKDLDNHLLLTSFKSTLRREYLNYILAGFILNDLDGYDRQIIEDTRRGSGTYILDHDEVEVYKSKETNDTRVDSIELANRFFWINCTFSEPGYFIENALMEYWKDIETIDKTYEKEKYTFKDDINVALYWLIHFALLDDGRYEEVKELIKDYNNEIITGAILFFDELKVKKVYPIEYQRKENTEIFSIRVKHYREQFEKAKNIQQK